MVAAMNSSRLVRGIGRRPSPLRRRGPQAGAVDEGVVGELRPIPALVAVHRLVAAARRSRCVRRCLANRVSSSGRKPSAERGGVSRPSVKAWSGRVGRQPGVVRQLGHRDDVLVERVDATRADEAHEVQAPVALRDACRRPRSARVVEERAVGDRRADPRQVLEHAEAGAEVEVPDLQLPICPSRQADGRAGRLEPARAATSASSSCQVGMSARHSALRDGSSPMPKPSRTTRTTADRGTLTRAAAVGRGDGRWPRTGRPSATRRRPARRRRRGWRRSRRRCRAVTLPP